MASTEQSGETHRDYGSPATWGDVEQVRTSLGTQMEAETAELKARIDTQIAGVKTQMAEMDGRIQVQMAEMDGRIQTQVAGLETRMDARISAMETRLMRWFAGMAAAGGLAIVGFLVGILQAVD